MCAVAIAGVEAVADTGSAAGVEAACPDRGTSSAETRRAALCGGVGTELCFESHAAHAGRGGVLWSCAVWRGAVRCGGEWCGRSGVERGGAGERDREKQKETERKRETKRERKEQRRENDTYGEKNESR